MPFFKSDSRRPRAIYSSKQGSGFFKGSKTSLNSAQVEAAGEGAQASVDSVMIPKSPAEPYVVDFAMMHDEEASAEPKSPQSPVGIKYDLDGQWLPEDDIAPPPPDFTRRDIHIPSRTRLALPVTIVID